MPDLGLCAHGIFAHGFLRFFALRMPARRRDRGNPGIGVLPMLARNLPGRLGTGRWSFHGPRLGTGRRSFHRPGLGNDRWSFYRPRPGGWHDNPGLPRSVGQFQPVGLRRFVQCKGRLHLALMLRLLSRRRSGLDRNRGAQANQTKKGEPYRPGHSRSQRPCRLDPDVIQSSRLNSGGSVASNVNLERSSSVPRPSKGSKNRRIPGPDDTQGSHRPRAPSRV
jgi:hypothetical protein